MTSQFTQYRKAVEDARHNREMEDISREGQKLEKRGQDIKAVTDVIGTVGRMFRGGSGGSSSGGRRYSYTDGNDVNWWKVPEVIPAGTKITTVYPLSRMLDVQQKGNPIDLTSEIIIPFMPTIGGAEQQTYFNRALDALFQRARQDNTSVPAYTRADPGKLLLAFDSIYMLVEHAKTCLRVAMTHSEKNRLHSWRLLSAIRDAQNITGGYQTDSSMATVTISESMYDELCDRLPALRSSLNSFIKSLNEWNIPNCFPFMINHIWMVSRLYAEDADRFAEEYVFVPKYYYRYDQAHADLRLVKVNQGTSYADYIEQLITAANAAYDAIADQDFAQLVTGDFAKEKMFGTQDSHYVRIPYINEGDEQNVTYDPEALHRIIHMQFVNSELLQDGTTRLNLGQFDVFETATGQLHSGIMHIRDEIEDFAIAVANNQKGDSAKQIAQKLTYIIMGSTGTASITNSYSISWNPTESEPTHPNMILPYFYETRGKLLGGDTQLSEDDVLLATRGQYAVTGVQLEVYYTSPASNLRYREGMMGLGIEDLGTELYFTPVIFRFGTANDQYQIVQSRCMNTLTTKLQDVVTNGTGYKCFSGSLSHASHAPRTFWYYCDTSNGYSGGPILRQGSYLAIRHSAAGAWVLPEEGANSFAQVNGDVTNLIWLPAENIRWCHNSACQRAFTPNF